MSDNLGTSFLGFGDNYLARNDDESSAFIDITSVFEDGLNFFGTNYQGFYINNNGNITFNAPLETYTPFNLTGDTGIPIIAPFFADVDTRFGALSPSPGGNSTGSNLVYWHLDPENDEIIITWDDVGQYINQDISGDVPNAFQLIIKDFDAQHFHIEYVYEDIQWTVGGVSYDNHARMGYSAADGENFLELPQSGNEEQLLDLESASNIEQPGRFIFSVINGIPQGIEVEEIVIEPNQPKTELVSASYLGVKGDNNSKNSVISADGRYVVFESYASNLVANDTNLAKDIFVRDLVNDTIQAVSVNNNSVLGNRDSTNPSLSADGRYIVFESEASNFIDNDSGSSNNIFVHDLIEDTTELVSTQTDGSPAYSVEPSISANGRYVAFASFSDNIVSGDNNSEGDIFVKDLINGTTEIASVATGGYGGNDSSQYPSISADGRYVAFVSLADNLVPGDVNDTYDIFVRDLVNDTTEIVSVNTDGNTLNTGMSFAPVISGNGRYVAFWSFSDNLTANSTRSGKDIFVRDLVTDTTELVTTDGYESIYSTQDRTFDISTDGRYVSFLSGSGIAVRDLVDDTTKMLELNLDEGQTTSLVETPSISDDGRYVAFGSAADHLDSDDTDLSQDIFIRDRGEFFEREEEEPPQQTTPSIEIISLTQDIIDSNEVTINYIGFDANSQAEIKLFYDNDSQDYNGILITDDLIETDGTGSFTWNADPENIIPGDYYIYAMISDEEDAYAFDYSEQTIKVQEILPDNLPLVLNPIADLTVNKNAANQTIDLSDVFQDADGDEIALAVKTNSNSQLLSTSLDGTDLTLDFADDLYGTSDITIEATANGETVSDTFSVTVNDVIDEPQMLLTDVHRFFQYQQGYHLYTSDINEINHIKAKGETKELAYDYEAEQYRVLADNKDTITGEEIEGVEPIYRFFNTTTGAHLYTMDENEKNAIQDNLPHFDYEGITYYAFESEPENLETIPVYRMYNNHSGAHLYSSDQNEINNIQETLPHFSMENNGSAVFHVFEL